MGLYRKLVGYCNRVNYWSNSKLSYRIQEWSGMEKTPAAASSKEWRELGERQKKVNPVIYWITEEGFDIVQDTVYFPYDVYRNIRRYIVNRFIDRTHLIDTKLEKGQWHEVEEVLLHGVMEAVVDFVEGQKAHMQDIAFYLDDEKETPEIKDRREAGLAYLDWEISLTYGDDYPFGPEEDFGKPTPQAECAKETKEIYLWWKDERPKRPDPHDASGWSDYCDNKRASGLDLLDPEEDKEKKEQIRELLDKCHKIEQQYEDEDTEMLLRIIKIRKGMWT